MAASQLIAVVVFSLVAMAWFALPILGHAQEAKVTIVSPERFMDAGVDPFDAKKNLAELKSWLEVTAKKYAAAGETLTIDVLDVDLAGDRRPGRSGQDMRVMKGGADWPRIKLHYALESGGQKVRDAEELVEDTTYLQRSRPPGSSETLYYEKRMLADWFKARFGTPGKKPG